MGASEWGGDSQKPSSRVQFSNHGRRAELGLDLMATSTEQSALCILAALKEEWERDPSLLSCRTESLVLGPLKSKHKIEEAEITRGIRFLIERRALDALVRKDGRATLPFMMALESASSEDRERLLAAFGNVNLSDAAVSEIVHLLDKYDVFEQTRVVAREHVEMAESALG